MQWNLFHFLLLLLTDVLALDMALIFGEIGFAPPEPRNILSQRPSTISLHEKMTLGTKRVVGSPTSAA